MKFYHKVTYYLLILFKTLLSSISNRSRSKLAFQIASILYHNLQLRRDLASENIKKAFPYWSDVKVNLTLRKTYLFFTQNLIEFISVPKSWDGIVVNIKGEEVFEEASSKTSSPLILTTIPSHDFGTEINSMRFWVKNKYVFLKVRFTFTSDQYGNAFFIFSLAKSLLNCKL